ncbi:MAG: hypothetical protein J0I06_04340 [Planctomycetes bacterium]|nr:hypothetical protein [Planctomycetota bacterium]
MTLRARFALFAAALAAALASRSDSAAQDKGKDAAARAAAVENMKKINVDKPTIVETDNFLVVGSIPEEKAKALAAVLEKTLPVARKAAKYDDKDAAWKGKLTVYYLPNTDEFKSFMRRVLQAAPEGVHVDLRAAQPLVVDPAELPGKPADADLFAATAARVAGELLQAKGTGTAAIPAWLRDGFGRAAQMRAEGPNSRRYQAYKAAARTAVLNPKGGRPPAISEAWSDAKSATGETLGTSVADFLAFGPKAADFGKFLDALRPSDGNPNPTVPGAFPALGWKDEAAAEAAWKKWVQTGK